MAAFFLFCSVALVSLNPVWIQLALWGGAAPTALIFWQALLSATLYTIYAIVIKRDLFQLSKQQVWRLLLLGVTFFLMALFYTLSLQHLNASYSVMLFFSYPFFVLLANTLIYKMKLSWTQLISLVILLAGVVVITWPQGIAGSFTGIVFAMLAAVAHATFIIYSGHNLKNISSLQVAMFAQFGFFAASLFLLPTLTLSSLALPVGVIYGSFLALLSSFLGFILFLKGVAGLGANRAALYSVSNLPLSLLFVWLILGDAPSGRLFLGFVLILAGLLVDTASGIVKSNSGTAND